MYESPPPRLQEAEAGEGREEGSRKEKTGGGQAKGKGWEDIGAESTSAVYPVNALVNQDARFNREHSAAAWQRL
jgi:hypothetical protein